MAVEVAEGIRVTITRTFPASPERVFRAFVDPQEAAVWMWAGLGRDPSASIDLRVGGRYRIAIEPADGDEGWHGRDYAMSGVYVEIDPPRRLVYTLHWEAPVGYNASDAEVLDEAVIVELASVNGGTEMVFQHVGIPDDGMSAAEHAKGVDASFDILASMISTASS